MILPAVSGVWKSQLRPWIGSGSPSTKSLNRWCLADGACVGAQCGTTFLCESRNSKTTPVALWPPGPQGRRASWEQLIVSVKGPPCPTGAPFHVSEVTWHHQVIAARTGAINLGMRKEWLQHEAARAVPPATARNAATAGSTPCQAEELAGLPRGCRGDDSSPCPLFSSAIPINFLRRQKRGTLAPKIPVLAAARLVLTTTEAKLQYRFFSWV